MRCNTLAATPFECTQIEARFTPEPGGQTAAPSVVSRAATALAHRLIESLFRLPGATGSGDDYVCAPFLAFAKRDS